jgi:hypothetical protein
LVVREIGIKLNGADSKEDYDSEKSQRGSLKEDEDENKESE